MKVTASWRKDLKCYRFSIHDDEFVRITGKRFRGNCPKSVRSQKAAILLGEQKRADLIAQHQQSTTLPATRKRLPDGRVVPLASDLFSLFVNEFYLPHIETVKAASTVKSERWRAAQLVAYFGNYPLCEIDTFLCLAFQTHRRQRENQYGGADSNIAINRIVEVLQKVLQLAVDYGVITANPARGITSLRELPRDRVLTHAEETRLVERLTVSPRRRMLALAVRFALLAGLRKGEILTLAKRDLDYERGLILIRDGKTGNGSVPLNPVLKQAINETIDLAQFDFNDLIFGGVDWIKDTFPQVCQEAEIEGLHFHDLRATFVTRMLENGFDAFTVAAAARHGNIKTTAIYARTSSQHLRTAVESLGSSSQDLSRSCPGEKKAEILLFRKSA
ncbi:MAG: site-specific integrase [Blastocatellia bacterium]